MFVCSLSAPLLTKYLKGINPIKYAILLLTGFSVAELIGINSDMSVPWQYFISYHFAYILVFYMGLSIFTQSRKIQIGTLVVCVSVYLISVGIQWQEYGQFCQTISYKYPPRIYYISYALSITYTLWIFRGHLEKWCTNLHLAKFLQFVGSHSIWIYFWHIPIVTWFDAQEQTYPNATIRFFIAFGVSTGIVFLQDIVVGLVTSHCKNERTNKLIKTLFIG